MILTPANSIGIFGSNFINRRFVIMKRSEERGTYRCHTKNWTRILFVVTWGLKCYRCQLYGARISRLFRRRKRTPLSRNVGAKIPYYGKVPMHCVLASVKKTFQDKSIWKCFLQSKIWFWSLTRPYEFKDSNSEKPIEELWTDNAL